MAVDFACSGCGQKYKVAESLAGKTIACRKCEMPMTVPDPVSQAYGGSAPFENFGAPRGTPDERGYNAANGPDLLDAVYAPPKAQPFINEPRYGQAYRQPRVLYAGFWLRVVAHFIDGFVILAGVIALVVVFGILIAVMSAGRRPNGGQEAVAIVLAILFYVAAIVGAVSYTVGMTCSSKQGTLGKMAVGIIVTDLEGRRLTFWRSVCRELAKVISAMIPFGIGYLLAAFTEQKQALHDMIASTLVVHK
jgi:uncharacterized RDD family membrane protein YckC